ncbi:hypothetical protein P805_01892 [Serratia marcescens BIDMC 44]|uniref:hypothetical protein n=1 Tax=Serratia marcescens TaxID=615 RepID=UPI00044ACB4D|nr:hypothetical protein [Serratia marcescens]ETX44555.1 hypothetical protein P805_01892 [Serratia marcescens BIDMC 44]
MERKLKKLIALIFALPICFYSTMVQATYVEGWYSDWRWLDPPSDNDYPRLGELDFNFSTVIFQAGDKAFGDINKEGKLDCYGFCQLQFRTYDAFGRGIYSKGLTFAYGSVKFSVDEANAVMRNVLPLAEIVQFRRSEVRPPHCLELRLITGWASYLLGSDCSGLLPPLPPTRPRPPEPLSCSVTWQSSGEIDFGVMTPGENKVKGIAAKLACQGGTSGKARLRFTDVNQVGANTVTLRKSGTSDEIKAKLSIGDPNSSNEQVIDVSPGFNATYAFVAKLDGAQLSGIEGGTFSGNALIVFEVI